MVYYKFVQYVVGSWVRTREKGEDFRWRNKAVKKQGDRTFGPFMNM